MAYPMRTNPPVSKSRAVTQVAVGRSLGLSCPGGTVDQEVAMKRLDVPSSS
jgi:hypothetical protein